LTTHVIDSSECLRGLPIGFFSICFDFFIGRPFVK
jgi:hypothetical protein